MYKQADLSAVINGLKQIDPATKRVLMGAGLGAAGGYALSSPRDEEGQQRSFLSRVMNPATVAGAGLGGLAGKLYSDFSVPEATTSSVIPPPVNTQSNISSDPISTEMDRIANLPGYRENLQATNPERYDQIVSAFMRQKNPAARPWVDAAGTAQSSRDSMNPILRDTLDFASGASEMAPFVRWPGEALGSLGTAGLTNAYNWVTGSDAKPLTYQQMWDATRLQEGASRADTSMDFIPDINPAVDWLRPRNMNDWGDYSTLLLPSSSGAKAATKLVPAPGNFITRFARRWAPKASTVARNLGIEAVGQSPTIVQGMKPYDTIIDFPAAGENSDMYNMGYQHGLR